MLEAEVYDNPVFLRQLKDAAASLHVAGGQLVWSDAEHEIKFATPGSYTGLVFNSNEASNYSRFNFSNVPATSASDRYLAFGSQDNGTALNITYDGDIGIGTTRWRGT